MNTYKFSRYDDVNGVYEYRTVQAKSYSDADDMMRLTGFRVFSITKPKGYHALSVNERINAKGNAGLLYTSYRPKYFDFTERPDEARLIIKRVARRDPDMFTPGMLLNKNTACI